MKTIEKQACAHCGEACPDNSIHLEEHIFCCEGCKTVYSILQENDLCTYYELESRPGISPKGHFKGKYAVLRDEKIASHFIDFDDGTRQMAEFFVPSIHCSSCIWLLETLHQLHKGIENSRVQFSERKVQITYRPDAISLAEVAELTAMIGYSPDIHMESVDKKKKRFNNDLLLKLGVAGFAFGNIMLLSLPEYFTMDAVHAPEFAPFFRWVSLVLTLPVVFYSASDYYRSSWGALRKGYLNIDIPISLGIIVLFGYSVFAVISGSGSGYFDSTAGLLFFLLLGKFFQRKTYDHLSFERDFKSYFPLAVNVLEESGEERAVAITEVAVGSRVRIRNGELIPCDIQLESPTAYIDNRFVTGESEAVTKYRGDKIFAGGRQMGAAIEGVVLREVSRSYLTQLWNNEVFLKDKTINFQSITDRISTFFTPLILLIAAAAGVFWWMVNPSLAILVVTSVLIVACPCALALSAPFAHGNALRILGKLGLYLKNTSTLEQMAMVDFLVFDKTGTLTYGQQGALHFIGTPLSPDEEHLVATVAGQSNHPLSRRIFDYLDLLPNAKLSAFEEIPGKGLRAVVNGVDVILGSASYTGLSTDDRSLETRVYLQINGHHRGYYTLRNTYRPGLRESLQKLKTRFGMMLLSGDVPAERERLEAELAWDAPMYFEQSPMEKLERVHQLKESGHVVMMIGDGLNDAGALQAAQVGMSLSEDVNNFSPACDAILADNKLKQLPAFLDFSKSVKRIIITSFGISFAYNLIGLYFAVTGQLSPIVAAVLMPVSSISVVLFTTMATRFTAGKYLSKT